MPTRSVIVVVLLATTLGLAGTGTAQICPGGETEGWDAGDLAGWVGAASTATMVHSAGGNPDGWVEMTPATNRVGLQANSAPWTGDWATEGVSSVAVDFLFLGGDGTGPALRLRDDGTVGGWYYEFSPVGPSDGLWHRYLVEFVPTWSDGQAEAAGWLFEGGAYSSFADTIASVDIVEVWSVSVATGETVGLDNFNLGCPLLFADNFETGTTTAWHTVVP